MRIEGSELFMKQEVFIRGSTHIIPSIINQHNPALGGDLDYNNQPWEITADIFAGIYNRNNGRENIDVLLGGAYFAYLYSADLRDINRNLHDIMTHQDFSAFNKAVQ